MRKYRERRAKDKTVVPGLMYCYLVEMLSMMERTFCYGQTGNAKVFAKSVMDPSYLSISSLFGGMPRLDPDFIKVVAVADPDYPLGYTVQINVQQWPVKPSLHQPVTSAWASLKFHYGESLFQVSICCLFEIQILWHAGL